MDELVKIKVNQNNEQAVSARELHEKLGIAKRFTDWFTYQAEKLGLQEGREFITILGETSVVGGRPATDYIVPLDIAKHICMVSGGEKAHTIREYFIQVERAWNSPEQVMARALQIANWKIETYKDKLALAENKIEKNKPKVLFAEAVEVSHTSILIGDLAKIIKQNGYDIGQKRLFEWLRNNGYLIKSGNSKNMPTQKSMDMELFEVKENTISNPDGSVRVTKTTKVTGKGQIYFINKFLCEIPA
jgi:anti-repressor protein